MGGMAQRSIVGREDEVARLRAARDAARAGHPTVVLVLGEPGVGKSSLLSAALGDGGDPATSSMPAPTSAVMVTASGDEAEVDLDYGILDQLRRGFPVPPEQRHLAEPAQRGADPHRVGAGLLRLIDVAQLGRLLVVVVDDAQWADRPSLEALTFGARRLRPADTVLLAVACRADAVGQLPSGLVKLAEESGHLVGLAPLDAAAVGELAQRRYGRPLPAAAAARLRRHAGGNPLHTRTLLDELPYEALVRPGDLPAPRSYAGLVLTRLAGCGPDAQSLLTALAVLGTRVRLAEAAAVAGVTDPLPAAEELTARDLARLDETTTGWDLAFPHGLVHASVAADLSPSRRVALHAAAARVTTGDDALRHRLAAAHGPHADLVAAARAAATNRAKEGMRAAAARLLLDAAPVASSPAAREALVLDATIHLLVAGEPLGRLAADVAGFAEGPARSYVLGRLALSAGSLGEAEQHLTRAWNQASAATLGSPDARLAGPAADLLAILALQERRTTDTAAWARRALRAGSESTTAATILCHALALDGDLAGAESEMTVLLDSGPSAAVGMDARLGRGVVRVWANDLDGAGADLAEVARQVGERGSFLAEATVRSFQAEADYRAGRWQDALVTAEVAASIVDDAGEMWLAALPHGVAASVLAALGRTPEAERHAEAAGAAADATGSLPARMWAQQAQLRVASARGAHADVAAIGDTMAAGGGDAVPEGVHHWLATYAEALVALGRLDVATEVVATLAGHAERAPADVSVAAELARARGLLVAARGDQAGADDAFAYGLALDATRSRPFERARLELAAGAHQRRMGRRRAAAELLARAADRFEALGAVPWSTRTAHELERCGLRPKRRSEARDAELTAQERLVARLVATGLTNREVASELVISAKTVEHHLSHVYAKLGVRSRTELAAQLAPTVP